MVRRIAPRPLSINVQHAGVRRLVEGRPAGCVIPGKAQPGLVFPSAAVALESLDSWEAGLLHEALDRGLATPEHAAVVARLAAARDNPAG
jgi:hypothetical protein